MNNQTTAACAAMQEQQQKPNVQDEPTAESAQAGGANAAREPQTGGGSAPSPCSASSDKHTIPVTIELDGTFYNCLEELKSLNASNNFSSSFLNLLENKLFSSLEIKGANSSTVKVWTGVDLRVSTSQDYIELLSALRTLNSFFDREVPGHGYII